MSVMLKNLEFKAIHYNNFINWYKYCNFHGKLRYYWSIL